jgi:hypothetical protein
VAESLTVVIRERKKAVDNLYRALKVADNRLEISERYLKRVKQRRRVVPEIADLEFLSEQLTTLVDEIGAYSELLKQGFPL